VGIVEAQLIRINAQTLCFGARAPESLQIEETTCFASLQIEGCTQRVEARMEQTYDLMVITNDPELIDTLAVLFDNDTATLTICSDPRIVYDQMIAVRPQAALVDLDVVGADDACFLLDQLALHTDSVPVPLLMLSSDTQHAAQVFAQHGYGWADAAALRKPVSIEKLRARLLNLGCQEREVGA
jgi:CheY-like chemotaxis protein